MPLAFGAQSRDARGRFTVRLNDDPLQRLIRDMPTRTRKAVDENAVAIRDLAQATAPRDTGSLAVSLYVSNGEDSDYGTAAAAAAARNPDAVIVPEARPEFVLSLFGSGSPGFAAVVGSAVEHGLFVEYGTVHMAPRPFLTQAVEAIREQFIGDMSNVADT